MGITFSVEFHFLFFLASSSMVDATAMCICPCNLSSTRSHRTSLLYHSTSGGVISSSRFHQSSQAVHNVTTNANNTTSASAASSSSVCYCPCSTATSTSYMSCKYVCGFKQFIITICYRIEVLYFNEHCVYRKEYSAVCSWYSLKIFGFFLAFQTTTVTVSKSMPLSLTGSASDNISLAVSLTSSPALSLAISKSTIAEVSSQSVVLVNEGVVIFFA